MLGFEPRISRVRSDRSANCVTTTTQPDVSVSFKPINCMLMLCLNLSQVCTISVVSSRSTAVEHTLHEYEVAGSNLAGCSAFF